MIYTACHTFSAQDVDDLQVGDRLPNCFGESEPVTSIHHKGQDINGKWFACFYQRFSTNATMSNLIKEGNKPSTINQ